MKSAVRLDDITIDMDWDRFTKVKKILDEAGIHPIVGVVPYCEDDNLNRMTDSEGWSKEVRDLVPEDETAWIAFLKGLKDKGWIIAMHGYKHVYTTKHMGIFPVNPFSEFAGVPYYAQLNMIKDGLKRLKEWDIETDIFMAPGHTFDKNTLRALTAAGITRMTDGFGRAPYKRVIKNAGRADSVKFYPISIRSGDCISDKEGYTTYVLHCNTMTDGDIESFGRLIKDNRDHFIDYSELLQEGGAIRGSFGNIMEYLTALFKFVFVKVRAFIRNSGDDDTEDTDDDKGSPGI